MDADLDTLATALYARADDLLKAAPERAPWRPAAGICPQITDAELVTLAVMQALLGFVSEARWLRFRPRPVAAPVPPAAPAARVQQAGAQAGRHHVLADPGPGHRHQSVGRRRVGDRLHPGGMRAAC